LVAVDPSADFLLHGLGLQMVCQFLGVVATLAVASFSGYYTGLMVKPLKKDEEAMKSYSDGVWWHLEY
jgi:Na+/H+-translocating membrane pyrophosphatase